LVAFSGRSLFISIPEVQLRMMPLGLQHFGSFRELSRLTEMRRLMLALAGRGLIFAVSVVVRHAASTRKPHSTRVVALFTDERVR
jgi:hypothetical protein